MQHLQQRDGAGAVGVQEAEVARASQALGQEVLQHQPKEIGAGQRAGGHFFGLRVTVLERDLAGGALTVAAQDVALLDDAAIELIGVNQAQVQQGLLAVADAAAIDNPGVGQRGRQRQAGDLDRVEQLALEDLGQGLVVEQVAAALLAARLQAHLPLLACSARHSRPGSSPQRARRWPCLRPTPGPARTLRPSSCTWPGSRPAALPESPALPKMALADDCRAQA